MSRKSYPKQFASLIGGKTIFQASDQWGSGEWYAAPVAVTNSDFRFIAAEQLVEIGVGPGAILIEPEGKNTAPAILAAALHTIATDTDAMLLVSPAGHVIPDANAFRAAVKKAAAREG